MKTKKKKALLLVAVFALALTVAGNVSAQPEDRSLPAEDDVFWDFFAVMSKPDDTDACLAKVTELSADPNSGVDSHYSEFCTNIADMPSRMQADMALEGASTNLFDASNWHSISGLYFQKTEGGELMGKISFSNTIDFLTYRFFTFMNNFGNMIQFDDGYISLNAAMVPDMINYGTTFTMYGLDFSEQPDIYVSNGATMRKAIVGTDLSGIVWDATANTLSFTPGHFSSFKAVEKGSTLKTMKITKVDPKSVKYKASKSTFRVNVKGKNLYKKNSDISCTLGFSQASKVSAVKNGKRVKCTFSMSEFSTLGYYPLTISIPGTGEVTRVNAVRIR